jgi:hypothetical protein
MPEDEWLDVAAAAERHGCSHQTIWRRIRQGVLPARKEKMGGRDGRPVIKVLVRVTDLNDAFGWTAREEHVRRIRASARPLTAGQKVAIRGVLLDHLLEREARRRWSGSGSPERVESRLSGESTDDSTGE